MIVCSHLAALSGECARYCSDNQECKAFRTTYSETRVLQYCAFYKETVELHQMYFGNHYTVYNRVENNSARLPVLVPCKEYTTAHQCPADHGCMWIPTGEYDPTTGHVQADPPCQDQNRHPENPVLRFSCDYYRAQDQSKIFYTGSSTNLNCDSMLIGSNCARTCNRTEYCASSPHVCRPKNYASVTPPTLPPANAADCARKGGHAAHSRCQCAVDTTCVHSDPTSTQCQTSPAAGGTFVIDWYRTF